ncbi:MAG: FAD-binding protein [Pirellulales bacterium]
MSMQAVDTTEMLVQDEIVQQLQHSILQSRSPVQPVGNRTKSALIDANACQLDTGGLAGIVTYDPSEFLITAKCGTPMAELCQQLGKNGQFLPFDPLFIHQGSTLGGTIASGLSGPDRLLYGGVRDFVMEVAMLDGLAKIVRGGGKVVKNAAGFDSPKMMVGSYGRMGVLLEATLKVFPTPQSYSTLLVQHQSIDSAVQTIQRVLQKPLPICSVVIDPNHAVSLRVAGPVTSLPSVIRRIQSLLDGSLDTQVFEDDTEPRSNLISWLQMPLEPDQLLVRIVSSSKQLVLLDRLLSRLETTCYQHCGAGSITWLKLSSAVLDQLDDQLRSLSMSAVVVRGQSHKTFAGDVGWLRLASNVQQAIDPERRFVAWN